MLRLLGFTGEATRVEDATAQVLAGGAVRTADLGGSATTEEVADAVISALRSQAPARTSETGGTR
jgi:isocitrate dehydrogenase (NAD+)